MDRSLELPAVYRIDPGKGRSLRHSMVSATQAPVHVRGGAHAQVGRQAQRAQRGVAGQVAGRELPDDALRQRAQRGRDAPEALQPERAQRAQRRVHHAAVRALQQRLRAAARARVGV